MGDGIDSASSIPHCDSMDDMAEEDKWVFYKDRPEWKDVTPVPQDDGPFSIVQIAYSEKFRDVYDYFRAVVRSKEASERALALTQDAIILNPANYTVWQYRRHLLKTLKSNLQDELSYIEQMIEDNPKNYQVWYHRQVIVEWLRDPSKELKFTAEILEQDAKNYHAWQHRQWVVRTFGLWENEIEYVNQLLDEDIRNNSAWNHRYFVINSTKKYEGQTLQEEVEFTKASIKKAIHNESPWNYLKGILFYVPELSSYPGIEEFSDELYNSGNRVPYLLAFMIDMCENKLAIGCPDREEVLNRALRLCDDLATEHDTIRVQYWRYVARCLSQKYGTPTENGTTDPTTASENGMNSPTSEKSQST